jgi:putative transposase
MPQSYTQLLFHIIFSTKDRKPWIVEPIRSRLHAYLGGGIRDEGGVALAIGGVEDHVHVLARLRQDKAISAVIGAIKANSSGWIHRQFDDLSAFAWQNGYAAFTVSKSQEKPVLNLHCPPRGTSPQAIVSGGAIGLPCRS